MSEHEAIHLRLDALEEWRREQSLTNKTISESLHRIELALQRSTDKACPEPGLCQKVRDNQVSKWESDKKRFEAVESNYGELNKHVGELRSTLHKGMGALGVLMVIGTLFGPYLVSFTKHILIGQ
jgi:hypothetical protein